MTKYEVITSDIRKNTTWHIFSKYPSANGAGIG